MDERLRFVARLLDGEDIGGGREFQGFRGGWNKWEVQPTEIPLESVQISLGIVRISDQPQKGTEYDYLRSLIANRKYTRLRPCGPALHVASREPLVGAHRPPAPAP